MDLYQTASLTKPSKALTQISITLNLIHGQLLRKAIALERPRWWLARGHWAFYQFQLGTSTTRNRELRAGALFGQPNRVYHWGTRRQKKNNITMGSPKDNLVGIEVVVSDQNVKRSLRGTCTLMVQTSINDYHHFGWEVVMNPKCCNSFFMSCVFWPGFMSGSVAYGFLLGKEWYKSEIMTNTMIMKISMSLDLHLCSVHLMRSLDNIHAQLRTHFYYAPEERVVSKNTRLTYSMFYKWTSTHLWDWNLPQDTPLGLQRGFRRQI